MLNYKLSQQTTQNSPPAASRSIFNIDRGPKVVRIMSATACHNKIKPKKVVSEK